MCISCAGKLRMVSCVWTSCVWASCECRGNCIWTNCVEIEVCEYILSEKVVSGLVVMRGSVEGLESCLCGQVVCK